MKLGRKDYTISVKTGTDANKAKFKKECVLGEIYHATDTGFFYIAEVTAGASDATLSKFGAPAFANQYSVSFDGTDDYMIAGLDGTASGGVLASSDADINLTISMWIKPLTAASGNGEGIFGWQSALSSNVPMITATTIRIFLDGAFRHSWLPGEMNDFTWNNLIITRTASDNTWRGYVKGNASPVFSHDDGGSITNRANASAFYLANQYFGYGNTLIDEVAVWNTNQDSNISTIYNSGVPGDLTSLSPVGWWRMGDNNSGTGTTITDQGSGSNDGTLTNGPTFSTDVPLVLPSITNTLSGSFDGTDDHLSVSSITLSGAKSVSLWVKFGTKIASGSGATLIANSSGDYFPYMAYGRYLYARGTNNSGTAGVVQYQDCGVGAFVSGQWGHVVISSDGTTMSYYFNGVLKGTDPNVDPQSMTLIGGRATFYHDSLLDGVALFNSALSASDVTAIYNSGGPADLSSYSPLHWWRMGDGTGDTDSGGGTPANGDTIGTIADQGSGSNNATGTNGPTYSTDVPT